MEIPGVHERDQSGFPWVLEDLGLRGPREKGGGRGLSAMWTAGHLEKGWRQVQSVRVHRENPAPGQLSVKLSETG